MRNIEELRNYYFGRDPQLKETLAANSLRLIGVDGEYFVQRSELTEKLAELREDMTEEDQALANAIHDVVLDLGGEATIRQNADTALDGRITTIETWKNNSDFIMLSDLTAALSNYYTKAQVDSLIADLPSLTYEVVESLPTTGISTKTIYLVPQQSEATNNVYDEYLYVGATVPYDPNNWELIGSTSVDLTNYYTKSEVNTLLNSKQGTLTAGSNISIANNTISATDTKYTAGTNVSINGSNVISATDTTYESKSAASGGTDVSLVTTGEKYNWNAKGTYSKPSGGIPKTDLESAVQTSLGKADTALQSFTETDPTVPSEVKAITSTDISNWNAKQNALTAGSNITISGGTISATDTTYTNFVGTDGTAAGTSGLVPAPATTDSGKYLKANGTWDTPSGGGGGTTDYSDLTNKPQINSITLSGNKSLTDLGIQGTLTAGSNITLSGSTISATDTTYESKQASSGGTDVSLVTTGEKYTWDNKGTYSKPSGGIPKTDLESAVQTSLGLADTALQSSAIANMEVTTNKVTSISSSSTDTQYPSAKCVYDSLPNLTCSTTDLTSGTSPLATGTYYFVYE